MGRQRDNIVWEDLFLLDFKNILTLSVEQNCCHKSILEMYCSDSFLSESVHFFAFFSLFFEVVNY